MSPQTVHQFAEKVALISDASSAVGRAVAIQLALQGSYVTGLFPDNGDPGGLVSELVELGTLAHGFAIDPSTAEGAKEAAEHVGEAFGRLDLLINCLKSPRDSTFGSMDATAFTSTLERGLGSAYFMTQASLPLMEGRPKPKVVNVTYTAQCGSDPLFEAAQTAVGGLTASLAARLPKNFRVNCVRVREPAEQEPNELFRSTSSVAPDDVARTILFLLSSESTGINGQIVDLGN
jgi:NAD(P)-dependent dehydrogenase (short-subunit alcohol dehydrogenase family)